MINILNSIEQSLNFLRKFKSYTKRNSSREQIKKKLINHAYILQQESKMCDSLVSQSNHDMLSTYLLNTGTLFLFIYNNRDLLFLFRTKL